MLVKVMLLILTEKTMKKIIELTDASTGNVIAVDILSIFGFMFFETYTSIVYKDGRTASVVKENLATMIEKIKQGGHNVH